MKDFSKIFLEISDYPALFAFMKAYNIRLE